MNWTRLVLCVVGALQMLAFALILSCYEERTHFRYGKCELKVVWRIHMPLEVERCRNFGTSKVACIRQVRRMKQCGEWKPYYYVTWRWEYHVDCGVKKSWRPHMRSMRL